MTTASAPEIQICLAIETSCDDTSVAVVDWRGRVLSVASVDQNQAHRPFGGVVPEIASRNHTAHVLPLVERAMREAGVTAERLDAVVATSKPGLIGSLLVGVVAAKSLALAWKLPLLGVNHLEGHLLAPFLSDDSYAPPTDFDYPYVALAISGGHTSLYRVNGLGEYETLGRTVDDAAGEAFDKFAKMVGLGFPGGPRVDRWAGQGNAARFAFPRAMIREPHFNFSFSGLKASAARELAALPAEDAARLAKEAEAAREGRAQPGPGLLADLCASFQAAVVDVLLERLSRAVHDEGVKRAVLTGGVSANSGLRARGAEWAMSAGVDLVVPPIRYCTDNAAMIGLAGILRMNRGERDDQSQGPAPRAPLGVLRPEAERPPLASLKGSRGGSGSGVRS